MLLVLLHSEMIFMLLLFMNTARIEGQDDDVVSKTSRNRIQFEIDGNDPLSKERNIQKHSLKSENLVKVRAVLHPGQEILSESIYFRSDDEYWQGMDRIYELNGLLSHRKYEVRVSYPAYCPAMFSLKIIHSLSELDDDHSLKPRRRLLNIEKMTFDLKEPESSADDDDHHWIHKRFLIVRAEREAPSFQVSIQQTPILFNLGTYHFLQ